MVGEKQSVEAVVSDPATEYPFPRLADLGSVPWLFYSVRSTIEDVILVKTLSLWESVAPNEEGVSWK